MDDGFAVDEGDILRAEAGLEEAMSALGDTKEFSIFGFKLDFGDARVGRAAVEAGDTSGLVVDTGDEELDQQLLHYLLRLHYSLYEVQSAVLTGLENLRDTLEDYQMIDESVAEQLRRQLRV